MYSRVKLLSRNFEDSQFFDTIKKICKEDAVSIVLAEGVLGKGDLTELLRRLRGVAPKSKFIFSLPETRFVKFLDPSVFRECLYFGGSFKDAPSPYTYQTSITEKEEVEIPEFEDAKGALGIRNGFPFKLHNKDWCGLVAYCLLPYVMDFGQVALPDALARIQDPDLLKKCKETFDA